MLKASDIAQVIEKYVCLSEAKSNDALHIVSVLNIFKLKWYERPQKKKVEGDHK